MPQMMPPVGKSGPLTNFIKSSMVHCGWSTRWTIASQSSPRLCGGMLVAMPTAMPVEPLSRRLGTLEGRTSGCWSVSS